MGSALFGPLLDNGRAVRERVLVLIIQYEQELNPAQLQAVTHASGPVLVIAGAGSGKTRTLVYRVAWLVEQGVEPGAILLLTFTRRSAEEMLSRAGTLLDEHRLGVEGRDLPFSGQPHAPALWRPDSPALAVYHSGQGRHRRDHLLDTQGQGAQQKELRFPRKGTLASLFSRSVNTGDTLETLVTQRYDHLERFTRRYRGGVEGIHGA